MAKESVLKQTVMYKFGWTSEEADNQIEEAREEMYRLINEGETLEAMDICQDYFGLEPDYIFDLM